MQANVICTELDTRIQESKERTYTGTCFRVNPFFLKHLPFYDEEKLFFVTNFHVVDDADDRTISMRTAAMGKSMFSAYVEAVVPKLDCAILSIRRDDDHPLCFLTQEQQTNVLNNITMVDMFEERISSKPQKVLTIGFTLPQRTSLRRMHGVKRSDDDDHLQLNLSINVETQEVHYGRTGKSHRRMHLHAVRRKPSLMPAFSIINYFKKYYHDPFEGFQLHETHAMTEACKKYTK